MKLADHADRIRQAIDKAFRLKLGRMGINPDGELRTIDGILEEYRIDRIRIESVLESLAKEVHNRSEAFEKLVEEITFTMFNRIAAMKLLDAFRLYAPMITREGQFGNRSYSHSEWLEQNPQARNSELEGLAEFFVAQLDLLSRDISLFDLNNPYHLLPTATELDEVITLFNAIETDEQVGADIWQSDDVLGWLYESYNNDKKAKHKNSGLKTEFDKVSIQSQVYTPKWVVQFLVNNSIGKMYLEMYPDSEIRHKYKIANAPPENAAEPLREIKPLTEWKIIDPATGSGNFLLYAFDLLYDLYIDQIEHYGADIDRRKVPELIIGRNLHGIDLDDRAVQLAQLGLYVKAKKCSATAKIERFNVVSSHFFLPEFDEVKEIFSIDALTSQYEAIVRNLWADLQQAYKFGSLLRIEEKFNLQLGGIDAGIRDNYKILLFEEKEVQDFQQFRDSFFDNLQQAMSSEEQTPNKRLLNIKTRDAVTYLRVMTQKYDVALANPPYTDSGDFGAELKKFIDDNYKKPHKFNSNLYATFIKRCYELTTAYGYVAMVHPPTFMYIKTFEDVRRFIIDKSFIELFVEWGYLGMFNPTARVDSAMYVIDKRNKKDKHSNFIKLSDIYEGKRYEAFVESYEALLANRPNKHNYTLDQAKLNIIEGSPFIYWISDGFREKFKGKTVNDEFNVCQGLATANNDRFVRFWWETTSKFELNEKWYAYAKGGPFNKWYGNKWAVVNWENNGEEIRNIRDENGKQRSRPQNEKFYLKEGITYSASGSKGGSFRLHEVNSLFDVGGSCIFPTKEYKKLEYTMAFLNSQLSSYIIDCLNPTVNMQVGDLQRVPFVHPNTDLEDKISKLAEQCIEIKRDLCQYSIIETNFRHSPLDAYPQENLTDRLSAYLNHENAQLSKVLLNEAMINEYVFQVYELSPEDREQVETKMGQPVGSLPISSALRSDSERWQRLKQEWGLSEEQAKYADALPTQDFDSGQVQSIKSEFETLYKSNNDLEEFCIRLQLNPINVTAWFAEAQILPAARRSEIALEFLAVAIREILDADDDGIIPLVSDLGEDKLLHRIEEWTSALGWTTSQFIQLNQLLPRPLDEYLEQNFFSDLSNRLNLFMYLPKTPFIWHLSSGEHHGIELFASIYKWNKDVVYRLKTHYLSMRLSNLRNRLSELGSANSAQAQAEKEKLRNQIDEVAEFDRKLSKIIDSGYDPKLDDGVGKNIAPLQAAGLLKCEVLKDKQLEKYLNADW